MNPRLIQFSQQIIQCFDEIPSDRKLLLNKLTSYIRVNQNEGKESSLMFICTHNSRRSHFGQILCALAAEYYQIPAIRTFSAGTEVTAFHPNAISALRSIGMDIQTTEMSENPHFVVQLDATKSMVAFSKLIEDDVNPKENFAAIMTCTHAEQNCPFVVGADFRLGLPFEDPKAFDGTAQETQMYLTRVQQMAKELFFIFSQLNA
ncbi:MAG: protein ArsC [Bacteroidota bacterium]|jgi:protein-tyrosine-phosphatase